MADASPQSGAPIHGPGGLLATPGMGTRRRKGRKWGVRTKAKQIVGNLYRGDTGKFQAGGAGSPAGATPQRGRQLSKQPPPPKRTPIKTAAPKKGGGKGKKPKKVAQTPEQRQAARAAAQAQNRSKVLSGMNIAPDGQAALEALRSGQQPDPAAIERGGFEAAGLVERAQDGSYRLSASGRSALAAASAGDQGRAGDTVSSARDRATARTERRAAAAERKKKADAKRAAAAARQAAAAKKPGGGGGGSGSNRTARQAADVARSARQEAADAARDSRAQATAERRRQVEARRSQAAAERDAKQQRVLNRLKRQAQAGNKLTQAQRDQLTDAGMADESGGMWRVKALVVLKDTSGQPRWIARTTTAYRDREKEILSSAALDADSQRMTTTKQFGPLRYWHVGQPDPFDMQTPWGPGLDIGDCDYSTLIGRTRVESGTFRDLHIAQKVAQQAERYELSPGFFHPLDQPDSDGVFHAIRTFERSIVPVSYGRASNLFTGMAVKETRMDIDEMEKRFKTAVADLGLTKEQALQFGQQLVATEKAAEAQGIAFKSDDPTRTPNLHAGAATGEGIDYPDVVINGVTYKAAVPPPAEPDATDDPIETKADDPIAEITEDVIEPEAEMTGDYIGDMSWDEFAAKLGELLAPVLKMQDMIKSIGDAHAELKGMYGGVAQKDDARAQELTALKASLSDLTQKIAQIEGDQPATILPDEVAAALKSAGPAVPAAPDTKPIESTPDRPWAGWAAKTFPELYQNQNGEQT